MSALQELQNYTFVSKYARWIPEKNRRETWKEAVERVKNMMHTMYADKNISEEINWAYDMMYKKKVLGSQRGLQFGGDPILKRNSKIFNCTASYCDRLRFFQECFWLLLCGSGTGFSVQKHHVAKLPTLEHNPPEDQGTLYVIEDSIEGWSDALGVLLSSYFSKPVEEFKQYKNCHILFDYSNIRPQGSDLSSGVGKAPGFEPLAKGLEKIRALLDRCIANGQKKLRPIDAYDIVMHSSDAVLSGGVRRSASLALFSADDEEMVKAKTGNWYIDNPQRARSNNSALLLKNETSFEQFKTLMESVKEFGEPGFIWAESTEMVFNPCVEVNLYPVDIDSGTSGWQGCVMGNTPIITKNGMLLIKDAVGKDIEIWNGREWSTVSPTITGKNREMYRVIISDGSYLDCTDNHRWMINNEEIETKNIVFSKKKLYINRPNISGKVGRKEDFAYEYGFILGDGTVRNNHSPSAQLFKDDNLLNLRCSKTGPHTDDKHSIEYYRAHFIDVDNSVAISIKNSFGLPSLVFEWDEKSILEFMAGWIDADGTKANNGCRLYGEEDKIRYAQILLTSVGINSSINLHSKKGTKTNISVRKKDLWYLQIPNAKKIPSRRIDLSQGKDPAYKGSKIFVRKIEKLEGKYTSYCFEEPKMHNGTFGNILTKQCNLSTINCSSLEDENDFYDRCKAAAIIGTLQAGFTKLDYLGEISCKIFQRESLLGVSLTGIMEKHDLVLSEKVLKTGAKIAVDTNKEMAKKIGINQAARVTCLKPEGTSSSMLGTSSGIHPHHAKRYIRHVQANVLEAPFQHFRNYNPQACEKSRWSANNTDEVIKFPIEVPDGSKLKNQLPAVDMLEIVKNTQKNWVQTGKNTHLCTQKYLCHNVSNTVTVRPDEWEDVTKYIYDNRKYFAGISLIPQSGDKDYPQAPFTTVYTCREIVKEYGDASLWCSGLIELALNAFDNNLWAACDYVSMNQAKEQDSKDKLLFVTKMKNFAGKYFDGDIRRLTYCMKDVYNWKIYCDLYDSFKKVDYTQLVENEDNTAGIEEVSCAGGACLI